MPRRIDWRVMMPNQVSIWLIQDEPTGVKWKCTCGFSLQPGRDLGGAVGGQVVQHDVHLATGVPVDGLLEHVVRPFRQLPEPVEVHLTGHRQQDQLLGCDRCVCVLRDLLRPRCASLVR